MQIRAQCSPTLRCTQKTRQKCVSNVSNFRMKCFPFLALFGYGLVGGGILDFMRRSLMLPADFLKTKSLAQSITLVEYFAQ